MMREQSRMIRISGLDGIRGLAVLSVIVFHFYFIGSTTLLGAFGVDKFFVLSGFLITGILLGCRQLCDDGQPIFSTVRRGDQLWFIYLSSTCLVPYGSRRVGP